MTSKRPLLAITMGDPAGVGPEVIAKALEHAEVWEFCRPLVVGDARWMAEAARLVGARRAVRALGAPGEAGEGDHMDVLDLANVDAGRLTRGRVSAEAGQAAYGYIQHAVRLALAGEAAGVVTGPINKEALRAAGLRHAGHTEILADMCGARGVAMMLVAGRLRVSHASTHVSLRQAVERLNAERIEQVIHLTHSALLRLALPARPLACVPQAGQAGIRARAVAGRAAPRIAVAGLNPHAGEGGLFGSEEQEIIAPAVEMARAAGIDASGPFPPDSVFVRASQGEFDAVVAMYHDQGHIAVKLLGFFEGVNVTLGLPIIRTSVDHGTAFDIAGTGRADERSLLAALRLAARMAAG
jgi:4-hydroxy-L-threonine phosphate dehydrogenase PdxA